ncbi:MAG: alpha-amylase [Chloroflexi bacterium]|nr:alpha-amylase [Chloroflexota bacterium]
MANPGLRRYPHLYEINTCLFVRRLSQKYGRTLTLMTVPDEEWQALAKLGFDLVWLMGVWQRSPGSRREALRHAGLREEYARALPGWTEEDVGGSPYAIYAYELNPLLGKPGELAQLKSKLNRLSLKLILDFVPNHLAIDHPWLALPALSKAEGSKAEGTLSHPERFVQGREADIQAHPDWFFSPDGKNHLAHGRDPYFPPWTDTVQVNFYSTDLRQALTDELKKIAEAADGVRCDMAMLALNEVFERVWGQFAGYPPPKTEFWAEAIGQVRQERPDFLFLAEAYWDLERQLQQLGFDFTYDKTLYDRLRYKNAGEVRNHLTADQAYQQRCGHFIENHDEPRAIIAFGRERSLAAAAVMSTVPGLRLFHEGQLEGRRIKMPVQLIRQPEEAADPEVWQFYRQLLAICDSPAFHDGDWGLADFKRVGRDGDNIHPDVLAWYWQHRQQFKTVVVNYSAEHAYGWLQLPASVAISERTTLREELSGKTLPHASSRIEKQGLYLELKPWEAQILDVTPVPAL